MIDARNVYRKVTRKIYDFSPEQQQNLLAMVWLYRGETGRYLGLVADYCTHTLDEGNACFSTKNEQGEAVNPLPDFLASLNSLQDVLAPFLNTLGSNDAHAETHKELEAALLTFNSGIEAFKEMLLSESPVFTHEYLQVAEPATNYGVDSATKLRQTVDRLAPMAETSRDLVKQTDLLYKLAIRLIETCEKECDAKSSDAWNARVVTRARKTADEAPPKSHEAGRVVAGACLGATQKGPLPLAAGPLAHRAISRGETARRRRVGQVGGPGRGRGQRLEPDPWPLRGRRPEEEDEDFDFGEALREIHVELEDLNAEAVELAATIKKNFEELGV